MSDPWFVNVPIRNDMYLLIETNGLTSWCTTYIDGRDGRGAGGSKTIFGGPRQREEAEAYLRTSIEIYGGYTMREAIG